MSLATSSGILQPVSLGGSTPTPLLWRSDPPRAYHEAGSTSASIVSDETRSSPSGNMCVRAGAAAMSSTSKKRQDYETDEQDNNNSSKQEEQQAQQLYRHQQQRAEGAGESGQQRDRDSKLRQLTACAAEQQHQHQYHHYQHPQQRHSSSSHVAAPRWPQKQEPDEDLETESCNGGGGGGSSESGRLKRNKPVKWSAEEDRRLREAVVRVSERTNSYFVPSRAFFSAPVVDVRSRGVSFIYLDRFLRFHTTVDLCTQRKQFALEPSCSCLSLGTAVYISMPPGSSFL